MTDVTNPTGETPAAQPQAAVQSEAQTPPTQPAGEDVFDKDRAMKLIDKFRDEEKAWKKEQKELQELRAEKAKRAEAEMTEAQKLQKQSDELKAENARLSADLWKREVIDEAKLPSDFAEYVKGGTKEEMLASAKKLAELLPKQPTTKTAPTLNATNPSNGQIVESDAQKRERLFGKPGDVFSGGGVIWTQKPD